MYSAKELKLSLWEIMNSSAVDTDEYRTLHWCRQCGGLRWCSTTGATTPDGDIAYYEVACNECGEVVDED